MTRVAGEPLGAAPLSHDQVAAVARALAEMYQAVPAQTLTRLPERQSGPRELRSLARRWIQQVPQETSPGPPKRSGLPGPGSIPVTPRSCLRSGCSPTRTATSPTSSGTHGAASSTSRTPVSATLHTRSPTSSSTVRRLPGLIRACDLTEALALRDAQRSRLRPFRRLMASTGD